MLAADGGRRLVFSPTMLHHDLGGRALCRALIAYSFPDIVRAETRSKRYADLVGAVDALGYYVVERRRDPVGDTDAAVEALLDEREPASLWSPAASRAAARPRRQPRSADR